MSLTPHYYSDLHQFEGSINPYTSVSSGSSATSSEIYDITIGPSSITSASSYASESIETDSVNKAVSAVSSLSTSVATSTSTSTVSSSTSSSSSSSSSSSNGSLDNSTSGASKLSVKILGLLMVSSAVGSTINL
ncbi:hypothetical protein DASC09_018780 [Saccharomycopsis crataegensis]|uniref:Uncharacterized protein n=1 Tax=Saccharomycopsis crataegensis TaxID=43959 RepID=A0AAV5QIF7_9ASCO|nr:hypothetical protein DASC09_018780 [Saccharomycopsis crataegensis]